MFLVRLVKEGMFRSFKLKIILTFPVLIATFSVYNNELESCFVKILMFLTSDFYDITESMNDVTVKEEAL